MIRTVLSKRYFLSLSLLLLTGCGGSNDRLDVTGTVLRADGSAPTGETALILFQPVGRGRAAQGQIEADGSFNLFTVRPGDGVEPGSYKVVLKVAADYRSGKSAVPTKYAEFDTTPLEAEVGPDQRHFEFIVE